MTAPTCPREVLEIARHEAGHVLASWWHGQLPYAVEMRRHDEGAPRLDRRGRDVGPDVRACVEAPSFIASPSLSAEYPETVAGIDPALWRDMVARDMLTALAGPAVEWRNARDPEELGSNLAEMLEVPPVPCWGDVETVDSLLVLLPVEERHEAYATACRRAEFLICRHWPELCALAERLADAERLEDEPLYAVLSETLGELPKWRDRPLEELDACAHLGDAEVVAGWDREGADDWCLVAEVEGIRLATGLAVVYMPASEVDELCLGIEPHPSGWYWMRNGGGSEDIGAEAPPAVGTLRRFLAGLVADKLEELRRDPDSQRHGQPDEKPAQVEPVSKGETATRMESPQ